MATGKEYTFRFHTDPATNTLVFDSMAIASFEYEAANFNDPTKQNGYYFPGTTTLNPAFTDYQNVITTNTGNTTIGNNGKRCQVKVEDYPGPHWDSYDVYISYGSGVIPANSTTLANFIAYAEEAIFAVVPGAGGGSPSVDPNPVP